MTASTRATMTALAAAVIAITGYLGTRFLLVGIMLLLVIAALGWPLILRIANYRVGAVVIGTSGIIALFSVAIGRGEPYLRYAVAAVAASTLLALGAEVFYPSPRGRAVSSVSAMATGGAVAASGAAWLAAARTPGAADLVVAGAISIVVSAIAAAATSKGGVNAILALLSGTLTGFALGFGFSSISNLAGALVGLSGAVSVVIVTEIYRREPPARSRLAATSAAITPVLVAGVLVYLGGRLLVG